jgi:thiol-disulfide isomerase/thioredoxin
MPQRSRISPIALLLLFPLLGIIAAVLLVVNEQQPRPAQQVTPPPVTIPPIAPTRNPFASPARLDFVLPALGGGEIALADYEGQPVILNFWATWCVPCERELPAIAEFLREQSSVPVIAINVGETAEQVLPWLAERSLTGIPVALDENLNVRDQYGVFSIPITYGLDAQGVVRQQKFGEVRLEDLRAFAEAILTAPQT